MKLLLSSCRACGHQNCCSNSKPCSKNFLQGLVLVIKLPTYLPFIILYDRMECKQSSAGLFDLNGFHINIISLLDVRWFGSQVAVMRAHSNQLRYPLLDQRGNLHILILVNQLTSAKEYQHLVNWMDLHPLIHQHQKKITYLPPLFYLHWLQILWELRFQSSITHALLLPHVPLTCILLVYHLV